MKAVLKENTSVKNLRKYPYLGKFRDGKLVVLFTGSTLLTGSTCKELASGVVVIGDLGKRVGETRTDWVEHYFELLDGTVELSND